jgi:site-specific recombinase XerD
LLDAWTDFFLSRQAMNVSPYTLIFYQRHAGVFLKWIENQGVTEPAEVTARYVRAYLAELSGRKLQDTTMHDYARAIKTLLRFWHAEGYIPQPVRFDMPKLARKRLPVLTSDQLRRVVSVCGVRDRALVLFMADSGLRRAEVIRLNWEDVNMQTGLVRVHQGKGKKDRSAVIGASVRRALLKYRRTLSEHGPLFQTDREPRQRLTARGLLAIFQRLTRRTGIKVTAHAMRRTFTILSLRAGMNPLHLQHLGGWESLEMVDRYAQMVDDDLLAEHRAHSPVDSLRD